jgi:hypothetical protein
MQTQENIGRELPRYVAYFIRNFVLLLHFPFPVFFVFPPGVNVVFQVLCTGTAHISAE